MPNRRNGEDLRVLGVLETCLYAERLEETARFYEEVIGLERFSTAEGRHAFFRSGSGVFLLFDPRRTAVPGGEVPPHGTTGAGHIAFAIATTSLDPWRSRLRALAIDVEREVTWPGGGVSLYLRDPAGNSVELTSPAIWSISEDAFLGRSRTE